MTVTAERQRASASRPGARARTGTRAFVGVDGEGVTVKRGRGRTEHLYVMLAVGAHTITDPEGLATAECLRFLLRHGQEGILVGFAFNYDVNMLLRDLEPDELRELWTEGQLRVELDGTEFLLEWVPSKLFAVTVYDDQVELEITAKVWDTWGYFQSSFVRALEQWEIAAPALIAEMKKQRSTFTLDMLDVMQQYNLAECVLLAELMEKVRSALHAVNLRPRSWLGAGSIAAALLARHDVDKQIVRARAERTPALDDAILRAYFGGRSEVMQQGVFATAAAFDVNSAYPYAAIHLPSLDGSWKRVRDYDPAAEYALWRCEWQLPDEAIVTPFPFRDKRAIFYPSHGAGVYHASEVQAALRAYPEHVRVTSGYVLAPADPDARPFGFLQDVYAERKRLKAEGHAGEKVLKLGINSVYGKLAQGNARDGRTPRFQDYFFAGAITAKCRAMVLDAMMQCPESVVSVATDGVIFSGSEPVLPIGGNLGEWDRTPYRKLFQAQPGMYRAELAGRKQVKRSRGFFTREIRFGMLERAWREHGPSGAISCSSTRFVGAGAALLRNDPDAWRKWEKGRRRLTLHSSRKWYEDKAYEPGPYTSLRLRPPTLVRSGSSDVYVPKRASVELNADALEHLYGVDDPHGSHLD